MKNPNGPSREEMECWQQERDDEQMSQRQYKDVSGNPVTLDWLVRNEPEWAANQIRHRDTLERENESLREQLKTVNTWLDSAIAKRDAAMKDV